jgi:hypothetical protein
MKSIATFALTFFVYIISVLASMGCKVFRFQAYLCVIMEVGGAEDTAFECVVAETFAEILAVNTVGTDSDYDDLCLNQFGVETFVFP